VFDLFDENAAREYDFEIDEAIEARGCEASFIEEPFDEIDARDSSFAAAPCWRRLEEKARWDILGQWMENVYRGY